MNNVDAALNDELNSHHRQRNMAAFWNAIQKRQRHKVNSGLDAETIASYYKSVMQGSPESLTPQQENVRLAVGQREEALSRDMHSIHFSCQQISSAVSCLRLNSAPGIDGISAEHFRYGLSSPLNTVLASLFSCIFSAGVVPNVFATGVIIPVLKKPML